MLGQLASHDIIGIVFKVPKVAFVLGQFNQRANTLAPPKGSYLRRLNTETLSWFKTKNQTGNNVIVRDGARFKYKLMGVMVYF
jgi:hypothetical protein